MKLIAKHIEEKRLLGDTLALAAEARRKKQEIPSTIDATIGTLSDEQGKFLKYKTIDKIIKNLDGIDMYGYSAVDGGPLFKEAVLNWVVQDQKQILDKMHYKVVATSGGTGAVSNAIASSLDENQMLLIPDIYWGPYEAIASANEHQLMKFNMIKDDCFNLEDFIRCCDEIILHQQKVVVVLNDPSNNPTGYSMSNQELETVISYMNNQDALFSVIYDIAYLDYSLKGYKGVREKFNILANAKQNIIISVAFSCSKTFSIYGLRTGAHIIFGKDQQSVEAFYTASCFLARTRWSNVSRVGIYMLITLMNDSSLQAEFINELVQANDLLEKRSLVFIKEAKANNLDLYPYHGGFFITMKTEDGFELADLLKAQNIYVLPFEKAIRISISALSIKELTGLAKIINNCTNECKK